MRENTIHIGEILKDLAYSHKISVEQMAEKLGYTSVYLYKVYKKEHLNTEILVRFAQALNISFDELLLVIVNKLNNNNNYANIVTNNDSLVKEISMTYEERKELDTLKNQVSNLEDQNTQLAEQVSNLEEQNKQLVKQVAQLSQTITQLVDKVEGLK